MSYSRLNPCSTLFLCCDVQEKFRKAIPLFKNMVQNIGKLLQAGEVFEVPLIATEQCPKKLGNTVKELHIDNALAVLPKTEFTMYLPQTLCHMKELLKEKPQDVVLFGLESHICILQSSIDFLQNNFRVHVVADCVASRSNQDRDISLRLMRQFGCYVGTSESVIFNLLQDKDHPQFKCISKLVKNVSADMQISKKAKKPKKKKPSSKKAAPKKADPKKAAPKESASKTSSKTPPPKKSGSGSKKK